LILNEVNKYVMANIASRPNVVLKIVFPTVTYVFTYSWEEVFKTNGKNWLFARSNFEIQQRRSALTLNLLAPTTVGAHINE